MWKFNSIICQNDYRLCLNKKKNKYRQTYRFKNIANFWKIQCSLPFKTIFSDSVVRLIRFLKTKFFTKQYARLFFFHFHMFFSHNISKTVIWQLALNLISLEDLGPKALSTNCIAYKYLKNTCMIIPLCLGVNFHGGKCTFPIFLSYHKKATI